MGMEGREVPNYRSKYTSTHIYILYLIMDITLETFRVLEMRVKSKYI